MNLDKPTRALGKVVDDFFFGPADARVYGLTRVALSLVALVSWLHIWPERYRMFADDGLIPPEVVLTLPSQGPYFSVFYWVRSHAGIDLVMLAALLAIALLGAGVALRLSAIFVYLWHLSYTYYAFPGLGGWDLVLRSAFFILAISPLGDAYRLRLRRGKASAARTHPRYGLVLLRWQVLIVYVATVWLKVGNQFWRRGEVLEYFGLSIFSLTDSTWFLQWPALMAFLTYMTLIVEFVVPFALWSKRWRVWGLALGCGLHLGIAMTSTLAIFSLVMVASYFAFLDGDDIDRGREALKRLERKFTSVKS